VLPPKDPVSSHPWPSCPGCTFPHILILHIIFPACHWFSASKVHPFHHLEHSWHLSPEMWHIVWGHSSPLSEALHPRLLHIVLGHPEHIIQDINWSGQKFSQHCLLHPWIFWCIIWGHPRHIVKIIHIFQDTSSETIWDFSHLLDRLHIVWDTSSEIVWCTSSKAIQGTSSETIWVFSHLWAWPNLFQSIISSSIESTSLV